MLKTRDWTEADQMEGGVPVKPTSGNTGRPVLKVREGTKTSLLSEKTELALRRSASARRTSVLLRWARSTTVRSETWACAAAERASAPQSAQKVRRRRAGNAAMSGRGRVKMVNPESSILG